MGEKEGYRQVAIELDKTRIAIKVLEQESKKPLRIIDINLLKENRCNSFDIKLSVDKGIDFLAIRVRMEYDLVSSGG